MDNLHTPEKVNTQGTEPGLIQLTKDEFFAKLQKDSQQNAQKVYGVLPKIEFSERNGVWDETIVDPKTQSRILVPSVGIYKESSDGTKYIVENQTVGMSADGSKMMHDVIASSKHDKSNPDQIQVTYDVCEGTIKPQDKSAAVTLPETSQTTTVLKDGKETVTSTTNFQYNTFEGETKPRVIEADTKFADGSDDNRQYTYDFDDNHVLTGKHWADVVHRNGNTITTNLDSDLQPNEHWTATYQKVVDQTGKVTAEFKVPYKGKQ
jgi:hypothetical protein